MQSDHILPPCPVGKDPFSCQNYEEKVTDLETTGYVSPDYASPFIMTQQSSDTDICEKEKIALEITPSQKSSQVTSKLPPFEKPEETVTMNLVDRLRQKLNIGNELYRAALSELFCTAFLLFCGCSVNAQFILSHRRTNEWVAVSVGWGLVLTFAVLMGYRISGAHLNPAVSFFQLSQGKISFLRFIVFVVAQNIGAFFGSFTTFIVYYDAINQFDNGTRYVSGPRATASIFATYPQPHLSTLGGVLDQIAGTAVLCLGIAAVTDRRNRIPPFLQPAFIGSLLAAIGMFLAMNAGYAVNPARDFGPRLVTLVVGYGWRVFSYRNYKWFWIPILCPMLGALIGAWIYEFFIGFHIPDDPETTYLHKILDDRNPDGQLREVHLVETKPISEKAVMEQTTPAQYRNM
uniref:Aquaporin 3 n=1 Tax=Heterorhabditis bacteriophora TaxID=37862 RepID=A0AAU6SI51_HETBA